MIPLLAAGTALVVSLVVIPLMTRLAPRLGLLDEPNARKIHVQPMPRVGGWGIAVGTLAAITLWMPAGQASTALMVGGLILLIAGAVDDIRDLPGKVKLGLQTLAVVPVVVYSGLAVEVLPLIGDLHLPYALATLLTVLGLLAFINATNTSDGLDGLAAGATLLSLFGILYVAVNVDAVDIVLLTAATLGGLIGFLRYNTHPAIIFMGDIGSQFLGFAVGFLALALHQAAPEAVSPWALLLLVGLPAADIAMVALRRISSGVSLFRPDKSHIHHRFLSLGFSHAQSVIIFYTLQAIFVFLGAALRTSSPWQILLVYALLLAVIYGFLSLAEISRADRLAWKPDPARITGRLEPPRHALLWVPRVLLETLLPLVIVTAAIVAMEVPLDFGILGILLLVALVARQLNETLRGLFATRISVFLTATAVLYLYANYRPFESTFSRLIELALVASLGLLAFIAVRFSPKRRKDEFRATAMDYLLIVSAILAIFALRSTPSAFNPYFLLYLPVVLYSIELLMIERRQRTNWLPPAALAAAAILTVRGLLPGI